MNESQELKAILAPTIEGLGYQLWGVILLPQGNRSILRIYIDKEDGITVDDCEKVSRQVSALLDVEDPIHQAYTLEVSSPGLDRRLFNVEQFKRYLKSRINIRLQVPVGNRRHMKGEIVNVTDKEVTVLVEGEPLAVQFSNIARANLLLEENLRSEEDRL